MDPTIYQGREQGYGQYQGQGKGHGHGQGYGQGDDMGLGPGNSNLSDEVLLLWDNLELWIKSNLRYAGAIRHLQAYDGIFYDRTSC